MVLTASIMGEFVKCILVRELALVSEAMYLRHTREHVDFLDFCHPSPSDAEILDDPI